jgi:hypothetical protein
MAANAPALAGSPALVPSTRAAARRRRHVSAPPPRPPRPLPVAISITDEGGPGSSGTRSVHSEADRLLPEWPTVQLCELEVVWQLHRWHYLSPALADEGLVMHTEPKSADDPRRRPSARRPPAANSRPARCSPGLNLRDPRQLGSGVRGRFPRLGPSR